MEFIISACPFTIADKKAKIHPQEAFKNSALEMDSKIKKRQAIKNFSRCEEHSKASELFQGKDLKYHKRGYETEEQFSKKSPLVSARKQSKQTWRHRD